MLSASSRALTCTSPSSRRSDHFYENPDVSSCARCASPTNAAAGTNDLLGRALALNWHHELHYPDGIAGPGGSDRIRLLIANPNRSDMYN